MARSLYNYTNKPHWTSNAANVPPPGTSLRSHAAAQTYASPKGWVQGSIGTGKPTTALTWSGGVATVTCPGHGLTASKNVLITGVTPAGYNGYHTVASVIDANNFTVAIATDPMGVATVQGIAFRNTEVVVAYRGLDAVVADVKVVPTFTAAITYSGTSAMVTGDVMTITLTASEAVEVQGSPKIAVTIGSVTRQATLDASSTDTSLVFKYTVVASDVATAGGVSVAGTTNGGYISDKLPANKRQTATVTFTAPDTSLVTVN